MITCTERGARVFAQTGDVTDANATLKLGRIRPMPQARMRPVDCQCRGFRREPAAF